MTKKDGLAPFTVPEFLKEFKNRHDDPRVYTELEPTLRIIKRFSPETLGEYLGPATHQLGLCCERRGDVDRAVALYDDAEEQLRETSLLGTARVLRDKGICLVNAGEPDDGLECVQAACSLHRLDKWHQDDAKAAAKADRQQRVGTGYLLRARVIAGDATPAVTRSLVELAIDGSSDFCLRDQQVLVTFARRYAGRAETTELDKRLVLIRLQRGRIVGASVSIANIVIGQELRLASHLASLVPGKERMLPRL